MPSLKPSLVEWKPQKTHDNPAELQHNLETFLSGMETGSSQGKVAEV